MKKYLLIFLMLFVTGCTTYDEMKNSAKQWNVYSDNCINSIFGDESSSRYLNDHEILLYVMFLENCQTRELIKEERKDDK